MSIAVPKGLQAWDRRIAPVLQKPFPPADAPDRKETPHWDKISTWAMLCEEVLDTAPEPGLLKQFYGELLRRGFCETDIQDMRHFAWLTVGWLNFEKALWEWCGLDESDIRRAIEWQRKDGLIDEAEEGSMLRYLDERTRQSEQNAPPNDGPAASVASSAVTEGPPSVT
jgi:hypothetical protein